MSRSELLEAVARDDEYAIHQLLAADPELATITSDGGLSLLMYARYLGKHGAVVAIAQAAGKLSFAEYVALGSLPDVRRLLDETTDVDTRHDMVNAYTVDGFTPLHLASFFSFPEIVSALLDHGADVHATATNDSHVQPIHSAAAGGDVQCVTLLLNHGAAVNTTQRGGFTPLHAAAQRTDLRIADALLGAGADRAAKADDGRTPLDCARDVSNTDLYSVLAF
jgi:uncharacterized protein